MFRVLVIGLLLSMAPTLAGCSSSDMLMEAMKGPAHAIVDHLPEWAGGPPKGLPPRPTDPAYAAYVQKLDGRDASAPVADRTMDPLH